MSLVSEHASPLAALGGADAGGQNVVVAELARALVVLGVEVTVFTRRDAEDLPAQVRTEAGFRVVHVVAGPTRSIPKDDLLPYMDEFAAGLATFWRAEAPDLVHAHFWMSGRAALAAARPLGVPVVQTFHALGEVKRRHQGSRDTSPLERIPEERRIIAAADHLIVSCSDELVEVLRQGADKHRVSVVPCGVDLTRFHPPDAGERRQRSLARLVTVSRLVQRKGIAETIAAVAGLPELELVIAGGPPRGRLAGDAAFQAFRAQAQALGVIERVRFLGAVDHDRIPELLRSADVAVCVPWYEPFGIVAVEAMACGVPVVASAVGGLVDTVVDGVTGLHVSPRDALSTRDAVVSLLRDPGLRDRMGAEGAARAREHYGWADVGAQTRAVYQLLTATTAGGRHLVGGA